MRSKKLFISGYFLHFIPTWGILLAKEIISDLLELFPGSHGRETESLSLLNRKLQLCEIFHLPNEISLQYDIIDVYNFRDNFVGRK